MSGVPSGASAAGKNGRSFSFAVRAGNPARLFQNQFFDTLKGLERMFAFRPFCLRSVVYKMETRSFATSALEIEARG